MTDPRPAIEQMVADLIEASERHRRATQPPPEPVDWLVIHHVTENP